MSRLFFLKTGYLCYIGEVVAEALCVLVCPCLFQWAPRPQTPGQTEQTVSGVRRPGLQALPAHQGPQALQAVSRPGRVNVEVWLNN